MSQGGNCKKDYLLTITEGRVSELVILVLKYEDEH